MSAQPVVQVEDLDVYYGTSQILFGVSLSVRQGETMALLGRNGAGKSTTMKAIMGLAPARRGKVTLRGRVVSGLKPHHIARAGLGFVPEDCWSRCATGSRGGCPAANSRCWRLRGR